MGKYFKFLSIVFLMLFFSGCDLVETDDLSSIDVPDGAITIEIGTSAINYYDYVTVYDVTGEEVTSNVTFDDSAVDFDTVGTYVVTVAYELTEDTNLTSNFNVSIVDLTPPTITSSLNNDELILELNDTYDNSDLDTYISCEDNYDESVNINYPLIDNTVIGSSDVTISCFDGFSNEASYTFKVTVVDTTNPTFSIANQTIEAGMYDSLESFMMDINDNSLLSTLVYSEPSNVMDYDTPGSYSVTLRLTDLSGNYYEEQAVITVVDTQTPSLNTTTYEIEATLEDIDWTTYVTDYTDNSDGDITLFEVQDLVDYGTIGSYQVSISLTDEAGNEVYEIIDVTVLDTIAPTFDAIGNQTIEAGTNDIDWTTYITNPADNSNDELSMTEIDDVDYDTPGDYNVTISLSDESGNQYNETITVTVEDTVAPTFDTIGDLTLEASQDAYDFTSYIANTSDNSDGSLTLATDSSTVIDDTPGTYEVTVSVSDESGNKTAETFSVTITDTTLPSFDAIGNQTIEAGTSDIDWTSYIQNEADNSSSVLTKDEIDTVDYDTHGDYDVTISLSDESGNTYNEIITVTVVDTTAPSFDDLETNSFEFEAGTSDIDWTTYIINAVDNSDDILIKTEDDQTDYTTAGIYDVTIKLEDQSGNSVSKTITVTIVDTTNPSFDAIIDQTIEATNDDIDWTDYITNLEDNSDDLLTLETISSDVLLDTPGTYTVTVGVSDDSLNQVTDTFQVTIIDTTAPVLTGVEDILYSYGDGAIDYMDGVTATDIVDKDVTLNVTVDDSLVDLTLLGDYDVTYEVTDQNGNTETIVITVTVSDTTSPVITLNGDDPLLFEVYDTFVDPFATCEDDYDESCIVILVNEPDMTVLGDQTITYKATDSSGNMAEKTRIVRIQDTTAPTIGLNGPIEQTYEVFDSYNEIGYSCEDNFDIICEVTTTNDLDMTTIGTYTVTYESIDESGNKVTSTRTIHVVDTTAPVVSVEDSIEIEAGFTDLDLSSYFTVSDNYDDNPTIEITNIVSDDITYETVPNNRTKTFTISYSVTDQSSNETTGSFTFHVRAITLSNLEDFGTTSSTFIVDDYDSYAEEMFIILDDDRVLSLSGFNNTYINEINTSTHTVTTTYLAGNEPLGIEQLSTGNILIMTFNRSANIISFYEYDTDLSLINTTNITIPGTEIFNMNRTSISDNYVYALFQVDDQRQLVTFDIGDNFAVENMSDINVSTITDDIVYYNNFVYVLSNDVAVYSSAGLFVASINTPQDSMNYNTDIAFYNNNMFVTNNDNIFKIDNSGNIITTYTISEDISRAKLFVYEDSLYLIGIDKDSTTYEKGITGKDSLTLIAFSDDTLTNPVKTTITGSLYDYIAFEILNDSIYMVHGDGDKRDALLIDTYYMPSILSVDFDDVIVTAGDPMDYGNPKLKQLDTIYDPYDVIYSIDGSTPGMYEVKYRYLINDLPYEYIQTIIVQGIGDAPVITCPSDQFFIDKDAGSYDFVCTASDAIDGDITGNMTSTSIDFSTPGTYEITYTVTNSIYKTTSKTITVTITDNEQEFTLSEITLLENKVDDYAIADNGYMGTVGIDDNMFMFNVYDTSYNLLNSYHMATSGNTPSIATDGTYFYVFGYMTFTINGDTYSGFNHVVFDDNGNYIDTHPIYNQTINLGSGPYAAYTTFIGDQLLVVADGVATLYSADYSTSVTQSFSNFTIYGSVDTNDGIIFYGNTLYGNGGVSDGFQSQFPSNIYSMGIAIKTDMNLNITWTHIMDTSFSGSYSDGEIVNNNLRLYGNMYSGDIDYNGTTLSTSSYILDLSIVDGSYVSIFAEKNYGGFDYQFGLTNGDTVFITIQDNPNQIMFKRYQNITKIDLPGEEYNNDIKGLEYIDNKVVLIGNYDSIETFMILSDQTSGGYIETFNNLTLSYNLFGVYERSTFAIDDYYNVMHFGSTVTPAFTVLDEVVNGNISTYTVEVVYGDFVIVDVVTVSFTE